MGNDAVLFENKDSYSSDGVIVTSSEDGKIFDEVSDNYNIKTYLDISNSLEFNNNKKEVA